MKLPMSQPCVEWVDLLATVSLDDLSPVVQTALKAHLATCPDCAAVQADYQQMDARIRALAPARPLDGLPPALLQLWAEENQQHAPVRALPFWPKEDTMRTREEKLAAFHSANPQLQHRPVRRFVSGISAVAAVMVIAILVTALVVSRGTKPVQPGSAPNTLTSGQAWQTLPHLTNTPGLPAIAPSNPQVVYEAQLANTKLPTSVTLQRSDDDGATWQALPVPTGAAPVYGAKFFVSPLNAQSVFVDVQIHCPTAQATALAPALTPYSGGADVCFFDYFSTDGGAHWSLVHWPVHQAGTNGSSLGFPGMQFPLQAQGSRLYARIIGGADSSLVSSTDSGVTWKVADQPLAQQGDCIADYAPTPTGATVFARVALSCLSTSKNPAALNSLAVPLSGGAKTELWRTDDAGAHWTKVGPYPGVTDLHLSLDGAGKPALFLSPYLYNPPEATQFSVDGGKTWQDGPFINGQLSTSEILGTLSDGSILEEFTDSKTHQNHLFSWKPGQAAWHQLAGDFQGAPQYLLVIPSANGQETLWMVTQALAGGYSVQRLML